MNGLFGCLFQSINSQTLFVEGFPLISSHPNTAESLPFTVDQPNQCRWSLKTTSPHPASPRLPVKINQPEAGRVCLHGGTSSKREETHSLLCFFFEPTRTRFPWLARHRHHSDLRPFSNRRSEAEGGRAGAIKSPRFWRPSRLVAAVFSVKRFKSFSAQICFLRGVLLGRKR